MQLTNFSGREVASRASYSPDGTKIVFTHALSKGTVFLLTDITFGNFTSDIYVTGSNGGSSIALTNDGNSADPAWGVVNPATKVAKEKEIPGRFLLSQNYPNPFNPTTTIKYEIPDVSDLRTGVDHYIPGSNRLQSGRHMSLQAIYVKLCIYDILGREIKTVVDEYQNPGYYEIQFNGVNLPSGVYYYRLETGGLVQTRRMVLLK